MPLTARLLAIFCVAAWVGVPAFAQDVSACLITKTDTNPFFVKMKEGAQAKADELGVKLTALAGRRTATTRARSRRSRSCIADGVKGILLVADRHRGDRRHGQEGARRRHPGDRARHAARPDRRRRRHLRHRQLQGRRADRRLGQGRRSATRRRTRKIAYLDLHAEPSRRVDVLRDQGFMQGFGIDLGDPNKIGDEDDPRIVCHDVTNGNPRGRPQGDGELPAEGSRPSTSSTPSTSPRPPAPTRR